MNNIEFRWLTLGIWELEKHPAALSLPGQTYNHFRVLQYRSLPTRVGDSTGEWQDIPLVTEGL